MVARMARTISENSPVTIGFAVLVGLIVIWAVRLEAGLKSESETVSTMQSTVDGIRDRQDVLREKILVELQSINTRLSRVEGKLDERSAH